MLRQPEIPGPTVQVPTVRRETNPCRTRISDVWVRACATADVQEFRRVHAGKEKPKPPIIARQVRPLLRTELPGQRNAFPLIIYVSTNSAEFRARCKFAEPSNSDIPHRFAFSSAVLIKSKTRLPRSSAHQREKFRASILPSFARINFSLYRSPSSSSRETSSINNAFPLMVM